MDTLPVLTKPMRRIQKRLGRDLADYLREEYETRTQAEIGRDLGISPSTVARYMERLGIETRFPNQRPPEAA